MKNEYPPSRGTEVNHYQSNHQLANYQRESGNDWDESAIDLADLWRLIYRRRKLISIIFGVVLFSAMIATLLMRPTYSASANLELNTFGRNVVKFNNLQTENLGQQRYLQTQLSILQSRATAREVVQKLNLATNPEFNGQKTQRSAFSVLRSLTTIFSDDDIASESSNTRLAESIYLSKLAVNPLLGSDIIKISFASFDPNLAAKIANQHIRTYISLTSERRLNSSSEAKKFIERELEDVKLRVQGSEAALTKFARENNDIDLEDSNNIILQRLSSLNDAFSEVQSSRIDAETLFLQSKSTAVSSLAPVVSDSLINQLKGESAALRSNYLELSKLYKPRYPSMLELKAKIEVIESSIDEQSTKILSSLESNYKQLLLREKTLKKVLQDLKNELFDLQDRAVNYNILKREWQADKSLYSELLERSKELGVAAGLELNAAVLVEEAIAPNGPSSPNLKFNLLIASILGLGAGLGVALLLSLIDNRVNDVRSLEKLTGIPNLAVLPSILFDQVEVSKKTLELQALNSPGDIFGESLNSLRSSLKYVYNNQGSPAKVFAVTSSVAGEGKSLISTNLAISYALSGLKTLLIEADLRRPRLAKVFQFDETKGKGLVHSLNTGEAVEAKSLNNLSNLNVILAGQVSLNPVKELGSVSMQKLIAKCREEYDIVLLDCPPILGLADTIEISALVDSIVLVVGAHQTPSSSVEHSIERLLLVGAPIAGTIFNQANPEISGYDHYAYGYYNTANYAVNSA
jgi:capsular exopolysaccharide synthesis family protein